MDFALGLSYEVIIAGNSANRDTKEMIEALDNYFLPNKIVIFRAAEENTSEIDKMTPFTKYHGIRDGKATAYVCLNFSCQQPTTDINTMLSLISV